MSKPRFSTNVSFDSDPRFQLFEQKSVYDKLPGSYIDQPLGTLYPNALDAELNHTLAEAWRFNPVALSIRAARETACDLVRTPGHGLKTEVISWIRSIGLSRAQAQSMDSAANDFAAKNCYLYEHYSKLHGDSSGLNNIRTLQEELDDFYDPFIGEGDPSNPYDPRHRHNIAGPPPSELQDVDGTETDTDLRGLKTNTMRSSLPVRRGLIGSIPAPVSTINPLKHSSVPFDHGYDAALLPTPDTSIEFASAHLTDGPTMAQYSSMITPPLTGVNIDPASHGYYGAIIPADQAMPSVAQLNIAYSSPNTANPGMQANYQGHINLAVAYVPTLEAELGPRRIPEQIGRKTTLFDNRGEFELGGRQEGPYDFSDFCSASLLSEHSDLSDGSEPSVNADGIDAAARFDSMTPAANGTDGSASSSHSVSDADDVESDNSYRTTISEYITENLIVVTKTPKICVGAANQHCHPHGGSLVAANTGATSNDNITEQTAPEIVERKSGKILTPNGTPEQATDLAQDLEHSIHSAVSQTASLARVLGRPLSPKLVTALPSPQDSQKHRELLGDFGQHMNRQTHPEFTPEYDVHEDSRTQSISSPMQTNSACYEPDQLRFNAFTTPVPQRVPNILSADLTKPNAVDFTPEYYSVSETYNGARLDNLTAGLFSSPTNRTQGGQNALSQYIQETSSHPPLATYDSTSTSMSMSMSISHAESLSPEPEDMALTPTITEFDLHDLTQSESMEEVSLIEDSFRTTSSPTLNRLQPYHNPQLPSAYGSHLNAFSPASSSYNATPPLAPTTPNNKSRPTHHLSTPSHTHTLVFPPITPSTPTPAPKPSSQHHSSKKPPNNLLSHKNPNTEKKMQKSVKSVFASPKLGSRSPSPGTNINVGSDGMKFITEYGPAMKRNFSSSPTRKGSGLAAAIPARAASWDGTAQASLGIARAKVNGQDHVQAVLVPGGKRRADEEFGGVLGGDVVDGGGVRKRVRRARRMEG